MFPLRDINPTRRVPYVTYAILALNIAVYIYEYIVLTPTQNALFVKLYGVVPYFLFSGYGPALGTPFSSMFMHGDLEHLFGNMWFLHVFGDNVEDAYGHARYLVFYLFTGVIAALAHGLTDPSSHMPLVGASGAISGVLGAYVLMFPRARVITWFPPVFFFEISAGFFVLIWFVYQLLPSCGLSSTETAHIAFAAHIGGFLAGIAFMLVVGRPRRGPITYLGPPISRESIRRR